MLISSLQLAKLGHLDPLQAYQVTGPAKYCATFEHLVRIAFNKNHPDLETLILLNTSTGTYRVSTAR